MKVLEPWNLLIEWLVHNTNTEEEWKVKIFLKDELFGKPTKMNHTCFKFSPRYLCLKTLGCNTSRYMIFCSEIIYPRVD